ncbi:hypothetical protein K9N68_01020 [Kovacikia minuta CCNUW1]|uniref:hypothetical protein n=1 Tax=Kovacikia minuta TaxID=2931930 RepID=UPI001CCDB8C5|nr:hypothetical protein [Kovacikia minuta]UBF26626.1 hypothetical protein K9N68_01020 [Kovacikia minuta CCNUW1]
MKIQLGDILVAKNGEYYRVVECKEGMVSLKRVNGYTLFSCNQAFVESMFYLATSSAIA